MLAIRMQRTGRRGVAQFRVVVQDSHRSPKRGKVVAQLGSYNPHTKLASLDKEKAQAFLNHGAQPSDRVVELLKKEGVKLPGWITKPSKKEGKIRNPEKLRKNRPAEPESPVDKPADETPQAQAETEVADQPASEIQVEDVTEEVKTASDEQQTPEPESESSSEEVAAEAKEETSEEAEPEAKN